MYMAWLYKSNMHKSIRMYDTTTHSDISEPKKSGRESAFHQFYKKIFNNYKIIYINNGQEFSYNPNSSINHDLFFFFFLRWPHNRH